MKCSIGRQAAAKKVVAGGGEGLSLTEVQLSEGKGRELAAGSGAQGGK